MHRAVYPATRATQHRRTVWALIVPLAVVGCRGAGTAPMAETPRPDEPQPSDRDEARACLGSFLRAFEAGDRDRAWSLMGPDYRSQFTSRASFDAAPRDSGSSEVEVLRARPIESGVWSFVVKDPVRGTISLYLVGPTPEGWRVLRAGPAPDR